MTVVIYNESKVELIHNVVSVDVNCKHICIRSEKGELAELIMIDGIKKYISANRIKRIYDESKPRETRKIEAVNLTNNMI